MRNLWRNSVLLILFLLAQRVLLAQERIDFQWDKKYSFVDKAKNEISQAEYLKTFFNALQKAKESQINILHIGDSHLQADFLTHVLRENFQSDFGNAGRGLIVPYQLAATNSPIDIKSKSSLKWKAKRVVHPEKPEPIGIGGITIATEQPNPSFSITLPEKYSFNDLSLFYQTESDVEMKLQDSDSLCLLSADLQFQRFVLDKETNNISFSFINSPRNELSIFGINTLKKDKAGVIYHSIGANGALFRHYREARYFAEQTSELKPDVIIISLGTNESLESDFTEENFYEEIDGFILELKKYNTKIPILLTIPANSFLYKSSKPNLNMKRVADVIEKYAIENKLAYWDLQQSTGDAQNWKKNRLLRPDGVHYEKVAYELQGNLLYEALINSYNAAISSD